MFFLVRVAHASCVWILGGNEYISVKGFAERNRYTMKNILKISIVLGLVLSFFCKYADAPVMTAQEQKELAVRMWVEELVLYESNGNEDVVIVDSNGKLSSGCLQYQQATFDSMLKEFNLEGDIMDCELQKQITFLLMMEDYKNARHWYTSVYKRGLGLPDA